MAKSLPFATQDNQYPFSYLRMGQSGYNSSGVVLAGDMQVSPGTGLQVQISAGEAYVQQTVARLGSFYAQRGVYQIFDDSADNPYNTITAPVTYPRVDQVIARVYDSYEQSLSGSSYWRYEWLPGTETSGAQINNPSGSGYLAGAAALPDNSLRLAYCLATVGMSSWSSSNIVNVARGGWVNKLYGAAGALEGAPLAQTNGSFRIQAGYQNAASFDSSGIYQLMFPVAFEAYLIDVGFTPTSSSHNIVLTVDNTVDVTLATVSVAATVNGSLYTGNLQFTWRAIGY